MEKNINYQSLTRMSPQSGRRFVWSTAATHTLVELWQENIDGLRGACINALIYKDMADKMKEFGPTSTEIKSKLEKLMKKYKAERAKVGPSGGTSTWEYYDIFASVLHPSNALESTPIDSTDFSHPIDEHHSSSIETTGTPSNPERRRVQKMDKLIEIEERKLADMERMAEIAESFQKEMLEVIRASGT